MALLSTAMLYRAQRRRRQLMMGAPQGPAGVGGAAATARASASPHGTIALLLVSLPFVPAVAGVGGSSIRYAYQTSLTPDIVGQFLTTRRGPVKLFTWQDPQSPYPADALRDPRRRRASARRARRGRRSIPAAYGLYDLDRGTRVPLTRPLGDRAAALARAGRAACARGATCSSPRTRACSGAGTSRT